MYVAGLSDGYAEDSLDGVLPMTGRLRPMLHHGGNEQAARFLPLTRIARKPMRDCG